MALLNYKIYIEFQARDDNNNNIKFLKEYYIKIDDFVYGSELLRLNAIKDYINDNIARYSYNTTDTSRIYAGITGVNIAKVYDFSDFSFLTSFDAGILPAGQDAKNIVRQHVQFYECDNGKKIRYSSPEPINSIANIDIIKDESQAPFILFSNIPAGLYVASNKFNSIISFLRSEFITNQ